MSAVTWNEPDFVPSVHVVDAWPSAPVVVLDAGRDVEAVWADVQEAVRRAFQ